jgi:excisionase family DNA binding protein
VDKKLTLSAEEAARVLGIGRNTFLSLADSGRTPPSFRLRRRRLWRRAELESWVSAGMPPLEAWQQLYKAEATA